MHKRDRRSWFVWALGATVIFASCASAQAGNSQPRVLGLAKEKPATGRFVQTERGYMVPYTTTIPGTDVTFQMVPIPGGKFKMGSPPSEKNRKEDEGPQVVVEVEPFWMGKYEITWAQYKQYMALHDTFKDFESYKMRRVTAENLFDAITAPSVLYDPTFTFRSGEDPRQPAVTMTQYAAKQYTKWLSRLTGQFYRLPSEAEWEYACRAGTQTAYSFGDDPSRLGQYAWYYDNSEDRTRRVGQKRPNPWGLFDMHGNVAEWVLDEYSEDGYRRFEGKTVKAADAIWWPTKLYPRVVRGGSWEFDAQDCRSAARLGSDDEQWKAEDPQIPLSPWWYTTSPATGVGFRIIRPLNPPPTRQEMEKYWRADLKELQEDVQFRIRDEGRGAIGIVDPRLPQAIEQLKRLKARAAR